MSSLNKVQLIGNVGKDPEIRTFSTGGRVANLTVATSEKWREKSTGEYKERTEWHRVSVFNDHIITVIEKYVKKGSKLYIEGQLETRSYEQDGQKKYLTEIVLRAFNGEIKMLDGKKSESEPVAENVAENEIPF